MSTLGCRPNTIVSYDKCQAIVRRFVLHYSLRVHNKKAVHVPARDVNTDMGRELERQLESCQCVLRCVAREQLTRRLS